MNSLLHIWWRVISPSHGIMLLATMLITGFMLLAAAA